MLMSLPSEAAEDWQIRLSPYAWLASLEGDIGSVQGLPSVPVDVSPSDVIDDIEAVVMLIFDAKKGQHGLYADIFYAHIQADEEVLPAPIDLSLRAEVQNRILSLAYQYEFHRSERAVVDLLLGARHWGVKSKLTFGGGAGLLAERSLSSSESWTDPLLGVKAFMPLGETAFYIEGGAGLGGFGAGSDLFYEISAVVGYQWNQSIGISLGYRLFDVDYRSDSFGYGVTQQGLQLGLTWSF
jgi:hypothetical protein